MADHYFRIAISVQYCAAAALLAVLRPADVACQELLLLLPPGDNIERCKTNFTSV